MLLKKLKLPIIQAPMAGGINNPLMASIVANAGGVGSFGFAYSTSEKIDQDLHQTKTLTNGPINANFFVFQNITSPPKNELLTAAIETLKNIPFLSDVELSPPSPPYFPDLEDQLAPIWTHRPSFLTFHFGIPSQSILEKARSLNICVGITATSLEEALAIKDAGADFIIAQGVEAGGHQGSFDPTKELHRQTTADLVKECHAVMREIPIVAAGGIMTGRDAKAMLSLGAVAVQLGTAFLTTKESTANDVYKQFLLQEKHRQTVYTKGFSGRYAQGLENTFIQYMQDKPILPFPLQNTLTNKMRQLAAARKDGEYQSLWAGSCFALCEDISVLELLQRIAEDLR